MIHPAPSRMLTLALLVGAALSAGCQPAQTPATDAAAGVRAASAAWDEAHNAADLGRLMGLYSDSAVSMPYDRPALEGRPAIEADFREFFAGFDARHRTTIVSLQVAGEWAIERGRYELSYTPKPVGAPVIERGKHVVIRRRVDGAWRIEWEIWNRDSVPGP